MTTEEIQLKQEELNKIRNSVIANLVPEDERYLVQQTLYTAIHKSGKASVSMGFDTEQGASFFERKNELLTRIVLRIKAEINASDSLDLNKL